MTQQAIGRALVTGGHKRLGRAIALGLAAAGWDVCVHYRSDPALADEVVAEIRAKGQRSAAVQAELTDSTAVQQLVAAAAAALGGLELVVASAASWQATDLQAPDMRQLDEVMAQNARAPVDLVLQTAPWLRQSGNGRAIFVGDLAGILPYRGYLAHSMAKAALHAAVRALAVELAPEIMVAAVAPGAVLKPERDAKQAWNELQRRVPLGAAAVANPQLPVQALVSAVVWLSTAPRYVAGQIIAVDGGRSAHW